MQGRPADFGLVWRHASKMPSPAAAKEALGETSPHPISLANGCNIISGIANAVAGSELLCALRIVTVSAALSPGSSLHWLRGCLDAESCQVVWFLSLPTP